VTPGLLVLCDNCNRGFHQQCAQPPLTSIPEGEWLCPTCRSDASQSGSDTDESDDESADDEASGVATNTFEELCKREMGVSGADIASGGAPVDLPTYRWVLVLYLGKLGSCLTHTQVLL